MLQRTDPVVRAREGGWLRAMKRRVARTPLGPAARDIWRALTGAAQTDLPVATVAGKSPTPGGGTPAYAIRWRDGNCLWRTQIAPHPRASRWRQTPLTAGSAVRFEIAAPAAEVDALAISAGAASDAQIEYSIAGDDGVVMRQGVLVVAAGPVRELILADLAGLVLRIGAKYHVTLSCRDSCIIEYLDGAGGLPFEVWRLIERYSDERIFAARTPAAALTYVMVLDPNAPEAAAACALARAAAPEAHLKVTVWAAREKMWPALKNADIVLIARSPNVSRADYGALCFALHRRGVATVFVETSMFASDANFMGELRRQAEEMRTERRRCRYALMPGPVLVDAFTEAPAALARPDEPPLSAANTAALVASDAARRTPHVAIVSVLHRKADVIESFLEHVAAQTYSGQITVSLVDDVSPENDAERALAFGERLKSSGVKNRSVQVLPNAQNSGNCLSRLAGLNAVQADIYIVMDCDCLMNADFVAAHVFEHWFDDVDVVIGPLNIESNDRDPAALVKELAENPARLAAEADLQDPVQRDGFLNCITRNFSIKHRRVAEENLFDEDFSYSAKPDTGFGWEDVEMGYRLYAKGAVIRFTEKAFAVHCTHPSSASEGVKAAGSMRNFLRLFEKHPDLAFAGRRWACGTYEKIADWADRIGAPPSPTRTKLDALFEKQSAHFGPLTRSHRPGARRLRILSYRWHAPHQYELYKLPHDFTLVTGAGNSMSDAWSYDQRPLRDNVRWLPVSAINPRDFDLAILHFDENVLSPHLCNGIIPSNWGDCFSWLLTQDLPKVAICHGTAQFEGQYGLDPERKTSFHLYEDERRKLVSALSDAHVVCNSHEALAEWRFRNARVIWHGFDPQEFPFGVHDGGVLATDADFYRPHYRGAWEHLRVEELIGPGIPIGTARHAGAPIEMLGTNAFATRNFRAYVDRIGRFKAYLNTTLRSPMPRSRGEAMMTGVIPVCLRNHDVDRFIEQGVDGFYADTPEELAQFLTELFRDEDLRARMALAARRKAIDLFNHDRYLLAWTELLDELVSRR